MTGKDKDNLFDAYSSINKEEPEVVNEDVVSTLDTEDAAFDKAGSESSEPETFGDSGPNAVDDVEELKEEESEGNSEKNKEDSINNSNIMSKSTFDKLYEDVMGDENLALSQEMELGGDDMMGGDDLGGDDLGDEGGDVTVTLTSDQVDVLRDILGQVDGDGEDVGDEDLGDMGDEDDMGLEDSVETPQAEDDVQAEMQVHAEPKAVGNANHLSNVSAGSNKASGNVRTTHGNAKHGTVKEDPVPSQLGGHGDRSHKDAGNTGSGSNKPNNPGTPGVGNSLFGN